MGQAVGQLLQVPGHQLRLRPAIGAQPKVDHAKAQQAFLGQLEKFLKDFPEADDTPEALLQLANGLEFANKDDEALNHYKRITAKFPKSPAYRKAAGAIRRMEALGQPFQLVGNNLASAGSIDTTRYQGKVLVGQLLGNMV